MVEMETAAKAFEQHVELDEGVLATSAALETGQLGRVILQVRSASSICVSICS